MSEKEEVKQIVKKYDASISELLTSATVKEAKTVLKYFADQSNKQQRKLAGLEK